MRLTAKQDSPWSARTRVESGKPVVGGQWLVVSGQKSVVGAQRLIGGRRDFDLLAHQALITGRFFC